MQHLMTIPNLVDLSVISLFDLVHALLLLAVICCGIVEMVLGLSPHGSYLALYIRGL